MQLTKEEILANRLIWAKYLQNPSLRKHTTVLENPNNSLEKCCLGHGCAVFNIKREVRPDGIVMYGEKELFYGIAPYELVELVGLRDSKGSAIEGVLKGTNFFSLISLNDDSDISPQQIGKLMKKYWLEGGEGTPFIALD